VAGWLARRWQREDRTHCKVVNLYLCFITRRRRQHVRSVAISGVLTCKKRRRVPCRQELSPDERLLPTCPCRFSLGLGTRVKELRCFGFTDKSHRQHHWTCNMPRRDFAPPIRLLSLLCLVLTLAPAAQASLGDRQPEFKSCVAVSST
jgi:hypothetical protein